MSKPLFRTLIASLALLPGWALAASISFAPAGFDILEANQTEAAFSRQSQFTLSQASSLTLQLHGWSTKQNDLSFSSLSLSNGTQSFAFTSDSVSRAQAALSQERRLRPGNDRASVVFMQDYQLSAPRLEAGEWTLTVAGEDSLLKDASGFTLTAQATPVSAPATLALAGLSLAIVAGLRRRAAQNNA
jgi:hypothetical protein